MRNKRQEISINNAANATGAGECNRAARTEFILRLRSQYRKRVEKLTPKVRNADYVIPAIALSTAIVREHCAA